MNLLKQVDLGGDVTLQAGLYVEQESLHPLICEESSLLKTYFSGLTLSPSTQVRG